MRFLLLEASVALSLIAVTSAYRFTHYTGESGLRLHRTAGFYSGRQQSWRRRQWLQSVPEQCCVSDGACATQMAREKVATRTDWDESISSPAVNDCSVENPGIATTAPPQGAESSSTHRPNEASHDVVGGFQEKLEMAGCKKVYRTPSGPNPAAQQALTNVVMTVEYDGSEYNGFVGPNHFYNDERLAMTAENLNAESQRHTSANRSVSNEVLRAIAVIHGYIPNRRKRKKQMTAVNVDEEAVCDVDDDVCTYTLPAERRFTLVASSRTDKGVHATETACQYISFDREPPFNGDLDAFMDRVNRILPEDIRVTAMIAAPKPEFNVRFDNIGKCYTYKVDLSECPSLFERKHHWQIVADSQFRNTLLKKYNEVREQFSFDRVREAADVIQGTHNFEGFRKKSRGNEKMITKNPICTIHRIDIRRNDTEVGQNKFQFVIHGDRFLYKMVRGIVSHVVLVGYGVLKVDDIRLMLERGEAIPDIPYAPSNGLYLTKVKFQHGVEAAIAESKERRCQRLRSLLKPLVEHRDNTLC